MTDWDHMWWAANVLLAEATDQGTFHQAVQVSCPAATCTALYVPLRDLVRVICDYALLGICLPASTSLLAGQKCSMVRALLEVCAIPLLLLMQLYGIT